MIVILLCHGFQIAAPLLLEVARVVVLCLVNIPHVRILVQHEHSKTVARFQRRHGTGIVRRTDGVVARLLQQFHLARIGKRVVDRAQDAVIVVDARAAQNDTLAVDTKAVFAAVRRRECDPRGSVQCRSAQQPSVSLFGFASKQPLYSCASGGGKNDEARVVDYITAFRE